MKFRLYTKNDCPYCQLAIRVVVEITEGQEKFIGGFNDLKEYLNKGKQLLQG